MDKKIVVKSLYRIGIVVWNIEEKVKTFQKYFDLAPKTIQMMDAQLVENNHDDEPCINTTYMGKPLAFDTKCCIFPLGGIEIELLEPMEHRGPYYDFLMEHGEGLHHFNIDVDDVPAFHTLMEQLGAPSLTSGDIGTLHYEYFDSRKPLGMILETCVFDT